jgi:hypothetical protein
MATIDLVIGSSNKYHSNTVIWETLTATDVGEAREYEDFNDRTIHVLGTFGGTVSIQGSNDGVNYLTLTDNSGLPLEFTADGMKLIAEAPRFIRPSAGSGVSDVDVILYETGVKK